LQDARRVMQLVERLRSKRFDGHWTTEDLADAG
jgi:hypothetical protein